MKVYVVMIHDYSGDSFLYNIYSTKKRAEEIVEKIRNGEVECECMSVVSFEMEVKE